MTRGLLDRWFGPAEPAEVAEARQELERLAADRPALAAPAARLAELLPLLVLPAESAARCALSPERADVKLRGGLPLLRGETLTFDVRAAQKRGAEIATRLGERPLADAIRSGALSLTEELAARLTGRAEEELARTVALGLEIGATATVFRLTFFPLLVPLAAALAPLRRDTLWGRGSCPTCGSAPLLGELRGLEQDRWLRCGLCASDWEFPRLACPFCDNRDHQKLTYLHVEGEEGRQRLSVCEECGSGVKQVATLAALSPWRLLAADVATLHLDLAAAERGILTGG